LLAGEAPTPFIHKVAAMYRSLTAGYAGSRPVPAPSEAANEAKRVIGGTLAEILNVPTVMIVIRGKSQADEELKSRIRSLLPLNFVKDVLVICD
jgi:hypothetical protein